MLIFYYVLQMYNFCLISIEMEKQSLYETELKINTEKIPSYTLGYSSGCKCYLRISMFVELFLDFAGVNVHGIYTNQAAQCALCFGA